MGHDPASTPTPWEFAHGYSLASGAAPGMLQAPARPRCRRWLGQGPGLGTLGPPELRTLRGQTHPRASLGEVPHHPSLAPAWVTSAALLSLPCGGSSRDETMLGMVSRALVGAREGGGLLTATCQAPPTSTHPGTQLGLPGRPSTELAADLLALGPRGRRARCPKNNIHERLWPSDLLWLNASPPHPPTNHLSTKRPEAETWTKVA